MSKSKHVTTVLLSDTSAASRILACFSISVLRPILQTCTLLATRKKKEKLLRQSVIQSRRSIRFYRFPLKPHLFMRDRSAHKRSSFHSYNSTPASWYTSLQYSKSPNNKGVTLQPKHSVTCAHCMDAKQCVRRENHFWQCRQCPASEQHYLHLYVYCFVVFFSTIDQVPSKSL